MEFRAKPDILGRVVNLVARIHTPAEAPALVDAAFRAMASGRPGPVALECAIDVWGRSGPVPDIAAPLPETPSLIDEDAVADAAKRLGAAERILIVVGGGAQDASTEVRELSSLLQGPVMGFRRGRGVIDGRDPFSVVLPLGHELWREADAVLAVGTRLFQQMQWGIDDTLQVIRVDADPEEPERFRKPAVALVGDAAPILRKLIDALAPRNRSRHSRRAEMLERQGKPRPPLSQPVPPHGDLRATPPQLPAGGIF